ncbi:hypothetical protein BKA67DRAFT_352277 [Truncatella angustata]|uniref:Threonine/serine exporter-like N-terminal domain-containing protein n=1 Tax=Truncatella angustata TaxID=152316 RepID=A0A9P8UHM8_9PEZI|nr:uncharacterized protein BKA67DRAFT_352277 [Truncatella angustata]KAH6652295.1 hypothetical protein BKA67DRAFT_352277 [Truncatella angustata]
MDSSSGTHEFKDLEPPDFSVGNQDQNTSVRDIEEEDPVGVGAGGGSRSRSAERRVRFNSDAINNVPSGLGIQNGQGRSELSLPANEETLQPTTPTDRFTFSVDEYDYAQSIARRDSMTGAGATHAPEAYTGDTYQMTEVHSSAGLMHDAEYLRSFESSTVGSTGSPNAQESHQPDSDTQPDSGYLQSFSEAEALLKAHMPDHNTTGAKNEGPTPTGNNYEEHEAITVNPRGGIFYQILQTYQNPVNEDTYRNGKSEEPVSSEPTRSTTPTTPTRRKWYKQHSRSEQSLGTLSQLMEASSKLAIQTVKTDAELDKAIPKARPGYTRTGSGRIMSLIGLKREKDTKITAHLAGILQRQKYILKMCRALMLFGAPSHRLEEYLSTTAKVLDMDCQFLYIPGCMIISFDDPLTHTTEVKMVRAPQGVNLGKLQDVHLVYKEVLHDIIGMDEALTRLETIIKADNRWPVWLCVIMYGLASTAVSCFFSARPIDWPIIFVLGTILGVLQLVVAPMSNTYNTVFEVSAAILMTFLSRAIASIQDGRLFCFSALTQSSIAMILPGWLVLSSALELHSKAIVPGSIRMVYAIIYSLFLGYGITVGAALFGAMKADAVTETTCQNPMNSYWNFLFVPLYVFFTTFTVQAKWRQMPVMIGVALAGYIVNFYTSKRFAASAPIAYTFGAFTIGILANLYSRVRHGVAAAVLLPAVYVQVPGSLASSGAITVGLQTATLLTSTNGTTSSTESTQLNALAFNFAASMIQIAIGITVGLFGAALFVYPLGKRRSGLWTL